MSRTRLTIGALILLGSTALAQDPPKYPAGVAEHQLDGVPFLVCSPADFDPAEKNSLVVWVSSMPGLGFPAGLQLVACREGSRLVLLIVAPELYAHGGYAHSRKIVEHVHGRFRIAPARRHLILERAAPAGAAELALAPESGFRTVCEFWKVGAADAALARGLRRSRKAAPGILLFADPTAREEAIKALGQFHPRARRAEVRFTKDHRIPGAVLGPDTRELTYYLYWTHVMEGGFVAGRDESFEWRTDPVKAVQEMKEAACGGFIYFFSSAAEEGENTKALQQETFLDPHVREAASDLVPIKLDRAEHAELFASLLLKRSPAVVTVTPALAPVSGLEGHIETAKLMRAFEEASKRPKRRPK